MASNETASNEIYLVGVKYNKAKAHQVKFNEMIGQQVKADGIKGHQVRASKINQRQAKRSKIREYPRSCEVLLRQAKPCGIK